MLRDWPAEVCAIERWREKFKIKETREREKIESRSRRHEVGVQSKIAIG